MAIICIIFFLNGCVKQIQVPESEMDVIKDFQRIVVYGNAKPWTKTKINIRKGDQILIIAAGSVNVWPGHIKNSTPYERLVKKIGEKGHPGSGVGLNNQMLFRSTEEGRLMFCVRDWDYLDSKGRPVMDKHCSIPGCDYYARNLGRYQIDVFVFSDSVEDEIKRALKKIAETNPNDRQLRSAIEFAVLQSASFSSRSYDEEVSRWKSYKDVAKWMRYYYSYDIPKAKESMAKYIPGQLLPVPVKTARESFEEKNGMCFDAANFAKKTLNRIDPSYEAEVVYIERRPYYKPNHIVCSFKKDGQLYIIDYGVPAKTLRRGVFGPFTSLDQYLEFHIRQHPKVNRVKSISFGWPDYFKDRVSESYSRRAAEIK